MTENRRKRKLTDVESPHSGEEESETNNLSQKTSTEILNELFEAFGAEEFPSDENFESESKKSKKDKKKKKEKHKHKHKEKDKSRERSRDKDRDREKHKKRDRKSSSEVTSRRVSMGGDDQQSLGIKIEINKEKSPIRKEKSPVRKPKEPTPEPVKAPDQFPIEEVLLPRLENGTPEFAEKKEKSPELPSIVPKPSAPDETSQIFEKGVISKPPTIGVLVGPAKGRIQIKSLKTSAVFEQTIREVEEEARKRAEKFEEGELTPSSSSHGRDSTTPSLSDLELPPREPSPPPLPSPPPVVEVVQDKSKSKEEGKGEEKKARRSHGRKSKEKDKDGKHKEKSRSRSRERKGKEGKRHRGSSRERHREHSRERDAKRGERRRSSRERGRRPREEAARHRSRSRERERGDKRGGRRAASRERGDRRGRRADPLGPRTRDRPEDGERIDKRKLLAIARRNAMYLLREQQERMIQAGVLPGDSNLAIASADGQGGKTVAELTEYCKQLVKSVSGSSDDDSDISLSDGDGPTESFIHHPFTLKDRPNAIIMNIRNSTQLPTRSLQEKAAETSKIRSLQFPVSSGQQHRSSAEWVPVSPKKAEAASDHTPPAPNSPAPKSKPTPPPENQIVDIGSIISQKLSAMRKMQETAASSSKMLSPDYGYGYGFNQPQPGIQVGWESGQFTGSTGARMLTPAELASGQQAWARKDQLKCAAPVAGGMGMKLLQKMGWRPGEGLGKNKEGGLEPLKLDVKMDKKGLVAQEEVRQRYQPYGSSKKKGGGGGGGGGGSQGNVGQGASPAPLPVGGGEIFSGKHPVSVLVELCTKRHWNSPSFDVVFESGPDHKKNFVFKVHVNGRDYQPQVACGNKKQAKAMAAQHCLQELGLIVKM